MLNQTVNKKRHSSDSEKKSTRVGFGEGLLQAGEENENVVALCADLTESTQMSVFKNKFPNRFIEIGVAEQNLVTVASGMAAMGKIPFTASFATFSPGRNWEQIRTTICYNNRPVIIVGSHAGVSVGPDGGTHQALEDLALMRVLPNMIVLSPCDAIEAKKATLAAAKAGKPVYLRLSRPETPVITSEDTPFEIGKLQVFWQSQNFDASERRVGIITTGPIIHRALLAAKELEPERIAVKVVNVATIKPLDREAIHKLADECNGFVTVEDHQVAGGLGSAVSEILAQNHPKVIKFIGIDDRFGQSGSGDELLREYGLTVENIISATREVAGNK